ncbi:MAG: hypothetical protein ACHQNE_01570 [Candidatus Kapaibacterium sp.]
MTIEKTKLGTHFQENGITSTSGQAPPGLGCRAEPSIILHLRDSIRGDALFAAHEAEALTLSLAINFSAVSNALNLDDFY